MNNSGQHNMAMKAGIHIERRPYWVLYLILIGTICFVSSCNSFKETNLVTSNVWYLAGPAVETQKVMNIVRKKDSFILVTVNDSPTGEIELNVPIIPFNSLESNEGLPVNLPDNSTFVEITYKSSHLIKIQVRQGNALGTGCIHGGSHPRVNLPISPNNFTTLIIPWTHFKLDGMPAGELLDLNNLCKFNFVNYDPTPGATLEIKSLFIENLKL